MGNTKRKSRNSQSDEASTTKTRTKTNTTKTKTKTKTNTRTNARTNIKTKTKNNTNLKIDELFEAYMDKFTGKIGSASKNFTLLSSFWIREAETVVTDKPPEGVELLCSHMGMAHTDFRILLMAWKMQAQWQGYFTKEEWRRGLKELNADTIFQLSVSLSNLQKEIWSSQNFFDLYSFSFKYCLTEEKQKFIDIESICALLELVLGSQYGPQVSSLTEYLQSQEDYKSINMDQWKGFLHFFKKVNFPKLDNYDPSHAWPVILDSYVEWMQKKES